MKCPKCNHENPRDNRYCGSCGSELLTTESMSIPGWLHQNRPERSASTVRCPICQSGIQVGSRWCDSCDAPTGSYVNEVESTPAKRLELPRCIWWVKTEVIVRPGLDNPFIEAKQRLFRARIRVTHTRTYWITLNVLIIASFAAIGIFNLWLFNYIGALWAGILFVGLVGILYAPSFVLFAWSLLPVNERNRYYGP